ncbi:MAG: hypothetical protein ACFCUV_19185 [Rivularia sp. (in: cyanobacteria)]
MAANRIGTLVIGKNDLWKQSINLGNDESVHLAALVDYSLPLLSLLF